MLFSFKLWLEDAIQYDKKYRKRFERFDSSNHPFSHLFPEGKDRIAIPIKKDLKNYFIQLDLNNYHIKDKEIVNFLKDLGYEDVDYVGGYAKKGKRIERIGSILSKNKKNDLLKTYSESPQRVFQMDGNFYAIISKNPHDIAQMSYTRKWKSCMDLEGGLFSKSLSYVIRSGGLVAYLINTDNVQKVLDDKYIMDPIARVSIKCAYNLKDKNERMLVLEERVYPLNIKGFWETVNEWVNKVQDPKFGKYKVLGGYSDTYNNDHRLYYHYDEKSLLKAIENYDSRAIDYFLKNQNKEFSDLVYKKIVNYLFYIFKGRWSESEIDKRKYLGLFLWMYENKRYLFEDYQIKNIHPYVFYKLGIVLDKNEDELVKLLKRNENEEKLMESLKKIKELNNISMIDFLIENFKPLCKNDEKNYRQIFMEILRIIKTNIMNYIHFHTVLWFCIDTMHEMSINYSLCEEVVDSVKELFFYIHDKNPSISLGTDLVKELYLKKLHFCISRYEGKEQIKEKLMEIKEKLEPASFVPRIR